MNRIAMSPAAAGILRALIARAGVPRDRILLTEIRSTDWQSLTFVGVRHQLGLRVINPGSASVVERMCAGLEEAEFRISGQIVADIAVLGAPALAGDGSTTLTIEALTVEE